MPSFDDAFRIVYSDSPLQSTANEKNPPNKQRIGFNRRHARKIKQREVSTQKQVITAQKREKTALIHEMHRTIRQHFPDLLDWMRH